VAIRGLPSSSTKQRTSSERPITCLKSADPSAHDGELRGGHHRGSALGLEGVDGVLLHGDHAERERQVCGRRRLQVLVQRALRARLLASKVDEWALDRLVGAFAIGVIGHFLAFDVLAAASFAWQALEAARLVVLHLRACREYSEAALVLARQWSKDACELMPFRSRRGGR
jgi:hypothetical protein